jgi:hypothetical protein
LDELLEANVHDAHMPGAGVMMPIATATLSAWTANRRKCVSGQGMWCLLTNA